MEITVYILFSTFCFLLYYLAESQITRDMKIMKFISGASLMGLGVMSLQITYVLVRGVNIDPYTYTGEVWQTALASFYCALGLANIFRGFADSASNRSNDASSYERSSVQQEVE